jgi:hypothetical protein
MKNNVQLIHNPVRKGGVILISYFLFAACMQHDENLSPMNAQDRLSDLNLETAGDQAAMVKRTFTAHLNSGNETANIDSDAQGQAIFRLSEDGTELYYKLIVANIDDITMAHIHCGVVDQNGPPFVWLVPRGAPVSSVNGILAEGTITDLEVEDGRCAGISTLDDLMTLIRAGGAYVNVHTVLNGGGEIRGQIK